MKEQSLAVGLRIHFPPPRAVAEEKRERYLKVKDDKNDNHCDSLAYQWDYYYDLENKNDQINSTS